MEENSMSTERNALDRRQFLASVAAGALAAWPGRSHGAEESGKKIPLGFDNFSIRSLGWKAPQLIDYAASLKVETLLVSDLGVFENFEEPHLRAVKAKAEERGIRLQVGTGSICPTSRAYSREKWGPAEDHLKLLIRVAKAVGAPVARCYLGTGGDRAGDGGIYRHIEATAKVCKAARSEALDAGVKIAIENHAGDMQAWELATLIEEAGKDYVGATMDVGNAVYTMEDPMVNLEILGPHALTTGMRDTAVWETEKGATAMWATMGQGTVDWSAYMKRYRELCPNVPFVLEIISYIWPRDLPYLEPKTWDVFPRARANEFARFVAFVKRGRKFKVPEGRPSGSPSRELEQAQQKFDLEDSLKYCKEVLGLGLEA
jgi:sugar phosphate isomerase/epimerase